MIFKCPYCGKENELFMLFMRGGESRSKTCTGCGKQFFVRYTAQKAEDFWAEHFASSRRMSLESRILLAFFLSLGLALVGLIVYARVNNRTISDPEKAIRSMGYTKGPDGIYR